MQRIETLLYALTRIIVHIGTVAALLLTGLVVLSSIMRYLLGSPFHFTEELVGLLFMAMVFLTVPFGFSERKHIRVTVLTRLLSPKAQQASEVFASIVAIAFTTWFFIESWKFTAFAYDLGARTEQTELILTPWMALMPITFGLVIAVVFVQLCRQTMTLVGGK